MENLRVIFGYSQFFPGEIWIEHHPWLSQNYWGYCICTKSALSSNCGLCVTNFIKLKSFNLLAFNFNQHNLKLNTSQQSLVSRIEILRPSIETSQWVLVNSFLKKECIFLVRNEKMFLQFKIVKSPYVIIGSYIWNLIFLSFLIMILCAD